MSNTIIKFIIVLRFALSTVTSTISTIDPSILISDPSTSWQLPILNNTTDPYRCDFDIVNAADIKKDIKEFRNLYLSKNRPLLIRGATLNWPARKKWNKKYIYQQFDNWIIPGHGGVGDIINDKKWSNDIYSGDSIRVKHPAAASPYLFSSIKKDGTIAAGHMKDLQDIGGESVSDFKPLDDVGNHVFDHWKEVEGSQLYNYFSLGGSNSGLSLHAHEMGYCALIHGVKRWFMIIPDEEWEYQQKFYEKSDAKFDQEQMDVEYEEEIYFEDNTVEKRESFLNNVLPKMRRKPLECYQHPGDMIYVPNYYSHTVFNIGDTVAVSGVLKKDY